MEKTSLDSSISATILSIERNEFIPEGCDAKKIRKEYPDLTKEDIAAVLRFASLATQFEEMKKEFAAAKQ